MPSIRRHAKVRVSGKHLPLHRKFRLVGKGLYLHGQVGKGLTMHGGSFVGILKKIGNFAKGAFRKVLPFIKSTIKKHGPNIIEHAGKFARNTVIPAIVDKASQRVGVSKPVQAKIKELSKFVGEKGTKKLEEESNQLIRKFTGNGMRGAGLKKFK